MRVNKNAELRFFRDYAQKKWLLQSGCNGNVFSLKSELKCLNCLKLMYSVYFSRVGFGAWNLGFFNTTSLQPVLP
jgi:hypothetical protein